MRLIAKDSRKTGTSLIKIVGVSGWAGFCIGAIGYGMESILRDLATTGTYVLVSTGVVGSILLCWYIRWLRKRS
jgi:hypothetical protein